MVLNISWVFLKVVSFHRSVFLIIIWYWGFFFLNQIKPHSAYWHFNTNLLCSRDFKDVFKVFWEEFKKTQDSFKDLQQWWDFGKVKIKQFCQQYTRNITK